MSLRTTITTIMLASLAFATIAMPAQGRTLESMIASGQDDFGGWNSGKAYGGPNVGLARLFAGAPCDPTNDPTCCENAPTTPGCSCYSHDPPESCTTCYDGDNDPPQEECLRRLCMEDPDAPLCTGERVICKDGSSTDFDTDRDGQCNMDDDDDDGDGVPDNEDPSPWAPNPVDNAYSCVVYFQNTGNLCI